MNSVLIGSPDAVPSDVGALPPAHALGAPATNALLIQGASACCVYLVYVVWLAGRLPPQSLLLWGLLQGALAAGLAWRAASAWWWRLIHFLFVPASIAVGQLSLPPVWFLAGLVLLWLVHGATYRTQVPLHLSRGAVISLAAQLLPTRAGLRVADLGCGFGSVLRHFADIRPEAKYTGVEAAWLPFAISWLSCRFRGADVEIQRGDIWELDLSRYDVVYAYLSPAAMPRLWAKVRREMRPGTLLISNSFEVSGVASTLTVGCANGGVLHVWRMGEAD